MLSSDTLAAAKPTARASVGGADRFLAFAFAAADLLVETDADGVIGFAAGAFRTRLGQDAASYIGRRITCLFAATDHETLEIALAMVRQSGRIAPMVLHLADSVGSPQSVGAFLLRMDGHQARLSFSIGPLADASGAVSIGTPSFADQRGFSRIAEAALREGRASALGLVEVKGWDRVRECLSGDDRRTLEDQIGHALNEGPAGSTTGRLADGRYGMVADSAIDMAGLVARLQAALQASRAAGQATVEGSQIVLDTGQMPSPQATRALRYALGRFADGGHQATDAAGTRGGLAGIIAKAEQYAQAVRTTLAERRFRLLYQPVVTLHDRSVHHYEALLRPFPIEGLTAQGPQEFVAFAEALGLSEELDWAVLETAIAALQMNAGVSIAVNMSGLSMQNPAYRERLLKRLAELRCEGGKLDPSRLLIELTETAEIEDLDAAASTMERLRSVGVPVCLDDFGAGVAVFRYLRAFGVDFVKLDGDYVRAACKTRRDRVLVASMVELAITAGARVVAEMIETEAEFQVMQDIGVRFGQGWLFGKPGRLPGSK